ncbi:hypothetical protein [Marinobacter salarius]|uniref:hypothetical protein n=1 Tax=Marinobacter salarius TaxID=1420917 RepID=UPI00350FCCD2
MKTNRHRPDLPQYSPSAIVKLPAPSDDSRAILHAASQALDAIYQKRAVAQSSCCMKAPSGHWGWASIHPNTAETIHTSCCRRPKEMIAL